MFPPPLPSSRISPAGFPDRAIIALSPRSRWSTKAAAPSPGQQKKFHGHSPEPCSSMSHLMGAWLQSPPPIHSPYGPHTARRPLQPCPPLFRSVHIEATRGRAWGDGPGGGTSLTWVAEGRTAGQSAGAGRRGGTKWWMGGPPPLRFQPFLHTQGSGSCSVFLLGFPGPPIPLLGSSLAPMEIDAWSWAVVVADAARGQSWGRHFLPWKVRDILTHLDGVLNRTSCDEVAPFLLQGREEPRAAVVRGCSPEGSQMDGYTCAVSSLRSTRCRSIERRPQPRTLTRRDSRREPICKSRLLPAHIPTDPPASLAIRSRFSVRCFEQPLE